ncbi:MAG: pyruvate:ferredoxin (flavodoxin) oxidoreductase [Candidatus Handelsmanbacteria bacterium RIFCSPLOWO2_12_FULL_64_10]|uniref:Pyruvate:ferredoxin (Flavodoxin) oxidoreductase n=1 Tax=Handelsmanbacteria sp. (strain RIFCSPLOWO2_12_FULL_64_10) TaxID=1817868 RepID=A0A1F6C6V5_HANXR|nr:MAG: pyruvate:ferredoxin (flavodoxin) oxidoreductase [Candidatus Handelsmanbacteria bacterium RIFCSPLOWO2_12_FULL_64_10]
MNGKNGRVFTTIDANEAVAHVAYRLSEVIAIYPITPSSTMGEWADAWMSEGRPNLWGSVPSVVEMQSEGGAAGAAHGALQTGALTTTFTASQGLLLMIPNMYKIAGELTPTVFHVSARTLAAHALSIFGDHSDVMAARATGFALLCSASVQEAMDFALIAQAATLETRVPFLHFFDGFRTSHEVSKIEVLSEDDLRAMIDDRLVLAHRARSLSPERPVLRGTAQNPDVYFQAREAVNPFYDACPDAVQKAMDRFAQRTGRQYRLFEYHGAPDAERVVVLMGSGAEAAHETVDYLNARGGRVGVLKVRLYRPFDAQRFVEALPGTVRAMAVLDRTKEPGSAGEPLYLDCVTAVHEGLEGEWGALSRLPKITGGRYGLSSKEFTPAMVKGVFDNLAQERPKNHFTAGIRDDVTNTDIPYDPEFSTEPEDVVRALFYGLGADGTVGANKNSIKIIGEDTDNYAQGYFVYDSKKSGAITVSHLRFGPRPIRSTYLVTRSNFVACHQPVFLERYDMLQHLVPGGTFLLNSPYGPEEVWDHLPRPVQEQIVEKGLKFYVIDAYKVAGESGMGGRINTTMQVCFFAVSGVLPKDEAIAAIKSSIRKTYGRKGEEIVQMNFKAVDRALAHLFEVKVPDRADSRVEMPPPVSPEAPAFVRDVLGEIIAGRGDDLPVSVLPVDGTFPTGTAQWEKRNIAQEIPVWDPDVCIQCGKCAMVCPHGVIRIKVSDPQRIEGAPATFKACDARDREWQGLKYTIQVAPEDCTGCGICVDVCPAKNKSETRLKAINMRPQPPLREQERENWDFFLTLPELDRRKIKETSIRQQQAQQPLFEFSGACAGCGETPYLKLLTQLFGDRMVVANATGCSSIYGGNLPTTPWTKNAEGRGPAWSNSLFEDNAEFGLGFRLSIDKQRAFATELLQKLAGVVGEDLARAILTAEQRSEADIYEQRERVAALKERLKGVDSPEARQLSGVADMLVKKSVWIVGGDGWAYDIGFGGLDHVLASGRNVNVLVLDTEVYSNTGGQMSKSTPRGAVAKFAEGGKPAPKKDLGLIAMTYGDVYVARVAVGARDEQTLRAFLEAEAYDGPSLIIAYSHCIAHGIHMTTAMQNQKAAVESGQWPLYRYHPDRAKAGENPLQLDSRAPKLPVEKYMYMENRFKMLTVSKPEVAKRLLQEAQRDVTARWNMYEYLAARKMDTGDGNGKAN